MSRTWETFATGSRFETAALTVTETHLVMWSSLTGDWVPLHTDAEHAARTSFGERIAHGPLTLSMSLGLGTQLGLFHEVVAWLGLERVRAQAPVRIGDTIRAVLVVSSVRPTRRDDRGLCAFDYTVLNQHDDTVMTFETSVLVRRSGAEVNGAPMATDDVAG